MQKEIGAMSEDIRSMRNTQEGLFFQIEVAKDQISLLKDNIRILKSGRVVTVASEYKKAKDELVLVRAHLVGLTKSYLEVTSRLRVVQPMLLALVGQYKALRLVGGIVLYFKPKGNNEQK